MDTDQKEVETALKMLKEDYYGPGDWQDGRLFKIAQANSSKNGRVKSRPKEIREVLK